jgi:surfeit locus 1 family protein
MRLGFWQLSRAHEKLDLQTAIQAQTSLPVLDAQAVVLAKDLSTYLHRAVKINGRWQHQNTLFLDNRQMNGKPGFFVLTPFEFFDEVTKVKKTILVQRGWIARNFQNRQKLPLVDQTAEEVTLLGRIAPTPSKLYEFDGAELGVIRQNVELDALSREFKIELLSMTLLQLDEALKPAISDGLLRQWVQPNLSIDKHYGYMFQWWALSALIAVLYGWFQLIRPKFHRTSLKAGG